MSGSKIGRDWPTIVKFLYPSVLIGRSKCTMIKLLQTGSNSKQQVPSESQMRWVWFGSWEDPWFQQWPRRPLLHWHPREAPESFPQRWIFDSPIKCAIKIRQPRCSAVHKTHPVDGLVNLAWNLLTLGSFEQIITVFRCFFIMWDSGGSRISSRTLSGQELENKHHGTAEQATN